MNKIPSWLSFKWWWLLVVCFLLIATQFIAHLSFSLCGPVLLVWLLVQADWVKRTERSSRAIYWVIAAVELYIAYIALMFIDGHVGQRAMVALMLHFAIYGVGAIALCKDFERLSKRENLPATEKTTLFALFFGSYYFQLRLHELASIQRTTASGRKYF